MADIVGNTICADYLDYLQRDPANVGLDVLKDDRVLQSFYVGTDNNQDCRMALSLEDKRGKPRDSIINGVVDLVRQRFRFADIIYYHKTKVSASAMLAKVFSLIGKPDEIGIISPIIDPQAVNALAGNLYAEKENQIDEKLASLKILKEQHLPSHIMDISIGDDSLLLWLSYKAWDKLRYQIKKCSSSGEIASTLLGISLLQSIISRKLYKICIAIDFKILRDLKIGAPEHLTNIIDTIKDAYRNPDGKERKALENKLDQIAGWPGGFLLYVPDRKVQAKGIETAAFKNGELITLGHHEAVKDKMFELNKDYENLWRFLVFVHPNLCNDSQILSKATDIILDELFGTKVNIDSKIDVINQACWFDYVKERDRQGYDDFNNIVLAGGRQPKVKDYFEGLRSIERTGGASTEKSLRGVLIDMGFSREELIKLYPKENSLTNEIKEHFPTLSMGFGGLSDYPEISSALQKIAESHNKLKDKNATRKKSKNDQRGGLFENEGSLQK